MNDEKWQIGYLELLNFKEKYRTVEVPGRYVSFSGFKLGRWVHEQRKHFAAGCLPAQHHNLLAAVGFSFQRRSKFEIGVVETALYVSEHGTSFAPEQYVSTSGFALGRWQKTVLNSLKKGKLSSQQKADLIATGLYSARGDFDDGSFDRGLQETVNYKETTGSPYAPVNHKTVSGFHLGEWQKRQRLYYVTGKLSQERIDKLRTAGFVLSDAHNRTFARGVTETIRYRSLFGISNTPSSYRTPEGFCLGAWQLRQQKKKHDGTLSKARQRELESAGFSWVTNSARQHFFDKMYVVALRFYRKHGHINVGRSFVTADGHKLGQWLEAQRSLHARGALGSDQVLKLEGLGIRWRCRKQDADAGSFFERGCLASLVFFEKTGRLQAGRNYVTEDGFRLGSWQARQRYCARHGLLSPYRIARLREIGFKL